MTRSRRSQAWRQVGVARHLSRRAVKRARIESLVLLPVLAGILAVYSERRVLFPRDWDTAVRVLIAIALACVGWQFARDVGRALGPTLFRRMEPGTAGTVGFLIRLFTMMVAAVVAARVAGLGSRTVALGGAAATVVIGLAAQQTLGNVIAGTVLINARTFRVGERVRLQGGSLAGTVEGVVSTLGLMYTTLASGEEPIMVPNSVALGSAVVPLRRPTGVELRARLRPHVTPIEVEEIDGDEVVVRISATPQQSADGPRLATELLRAISPQVRGRERVEGAFDGARSGDGGGSE